MLSLQPATFGQIYWKDHEELSPRKRLFLVAKSFGEFADRLEKENLEEELDPIELLGKTGTVADLKEFLAKGGSVNSKTETGIRTGLSLARHCARFGNLPMLKVLVAKGASLEHVFHAAATRNQRAIVDYLLDELHRDINEKNPEGYTPWQCANIYPEMRAYLASRGAKVGK